MELHVDGRPTYSGVWPGSLRGSFMALLLLPQCNAAFSTIPSTLVWINQSPVTAYHMIQGMALHVTIRYG